MTNNFEGIIRKHKYWIRFLCITTGADGVSIPAGLKLPTVETAFFLSNDFPALFYINLGIETWVQCIQLMKDAGIEKRNTDGK